MEITCVGINFIMKFQEFENLGCELGERILFLSYRKSPVLENGRIQKSDVQITKHWQSTMRGPSNHTYPYGGHLNREMHFRVESLFINSYLMSDIGFEQS